MTNRMRVLRAERNLSQAVVSRRARIGQSTISRIENGILDPSTLEQKRIAKALRSTVEAAFPTEPEEPRRKLTRQERLQGMADRGVDTWEEYRGER